MNRIGYLSLSILIITVASCSTVERDHKLINNKQKSTLDSLGQSILDEGKVLGFSISIDSAGSTIYNGNFGYIDSARTQPVQIETRFDIASVSKLIGASVIMKLIEQNKLNLEQNLYDLLPDFPNPEQARQIQLRHLISHTSGLQDYALEIDSIFTKTGIPPKKTEFLDFFNNMELLFEPGSNYQYCNSGFMLMAFIAENATGKKWQGLVDEFINEPTDLDFQLLKYASDQPQTSPIFEPIEGVFKKVPTWIYVIGDGGLTATTKDLSKFPTYWTSGTFINEASFKEMTEPKAISEISGSGYGFGVRNGEFLGEPILGHTGGWKSTYAIMCFFPELDITFAGLMNTDGTTENMSRIFALYMSEVLRKNIPDYKSVEIPLEDPSKFVGEYHGYDQEFDNVGNTFKIDLKEGKLYYCLGEYCEPLYYMGENKFWIENYPYDYIEFCLTQEGNISALKEFYYGFFQVLRLKIND